MSHLSVLRKASKQDVKLYPYPHLVIEDALDWDLYKQLEKEYPEDKTIISEMSKTEESNTRYQINAHRAVKFPDNKISPLWKEFIKYHTSKEFFMELYHLFEEPIDTMYPKLKKKWGNKLERAKFNTRFINDKGSNLVLDCQPGINSKVTIPNTAVITPHADNFKELYAGLLYFRREEDTYEGGDLEIMTWKDPKVKKFGEKRRIDLDLVEKVGEVKYKPNTLVFFINSKNSIHAVTPRPITDCSRRLVNIIAETQNEGAAIYNSDVMFN